MLNDVTLDRGLRLGLTELGFDTPTEVQAEVVPRALSGKDLTVTAATGSGKTLAYLIPLAERILALRSERGRFSEVEDLLSVPGIGPKTLERLRDRVRLDGP